MKSLFLVSLCWLGAFGLPVDNNEILEYNNDGDGRGNYKFNFKTSDGTQREEESILRNEYEPEKSYLEVRGSYSYVGPDGVTYTVNYVADKDGFRPEGAHIPAYYAPPTTLPPDFVGAGLPPELLLTLGG